MRVLDLFARRLGWSKPFLARGHQVVAIDLVVPPEVPEGCLFLQLDIMKLGYLPGEGFVYCNEAGIHILGFFDFICASSPCEQFSVHGMKHFHPNPPYPEMGLKLFNHTRAICEASGVPYIMENVRPAQKFVGNAVRCCGPFALWGNGVPPLMPQGITKGIQLGGAHKDWKNTSPEDRRRIRKTDFMVQYQSGSKERKACTAKAAEIPPELANAVCDYAERILEVPA